jgi:cyanophycinase
MLSVLNYFLWLGATQAVNVRVATVSAANDSSVVGTVATSDVVFLKGGDQGEYYDLWNNSLLESNIRTVVANGGSVGGTSAGAMSLARYCFSGGQDLISLDVLQDAQTAYLNDASAGGSGLHTDFPGFVDALIDTHYTTRARLGRMLGLLGKAVQDNNNKTILAIGIEERTGLAITGTTAEVIGVGSVDFIQQTSTTVLKRDAQRPLYDSNLSQDRLNEGWKFNLSTRLPDTPPCLLERSPSSTPAIAPPTPAPSPSRGAPTATKVATPAPWTMIRIVMPLRWAGPVAAV